MPNVILISIVIAAFCQYSSVAQNCTNCEPPTTNGHIGIAADLHFESSTVDNCLHLTATCPDGTNYLITYQSKITSANIYKTPIELQCQPDGYFYEGEHEQRNGHQLSNIYCYHHLNSANRPALPPPPPPPPPPRPPVPPAAPIPNSISEESSPPPQPQLPEKLDDEIISEMKGDNVTINTNTTLSD